MAGMDGGIENEFPNLFFEYMAASGIPDGEAAGMLLDVAAESQRTGRVLPREVGWLGRWILISLQWSDHFLLMLLMDVNGSS